MVLADAVSEVARRWPFSPVIDPWGFAPGLFLALLGIGIADLHEKWVIRRAVKEIKRNREKRHASR